MRCITKDLAGRLYGLLISLNDWPDREDARLLQHFIEVGEYGLALEDIGHAKVPITDQERSDMLTLIATMNLYDFVPRALGFCPRAGSAAPTRGR